MKNIHKNIFDRVSWSELLVIALYYSYPSNAASSSVINLLEELMDLCIILWHLERGESGTASERADTVEKVLSYGK